MEFYVSYWSRHFIHMSCTYLLTPWIRVLLEKLIGLQLVKKFPAFYGTRRFITAFTSDTTYLLTYTMEQSPSWEAKWFAASQEIPRILWNPKAPHLTHKRPPTIPILNQPNPVLTPTCHFLKIHPNIVLPSTPRSPQRSLSLRLPHQNHRCHVH
jgi:hypothetical protein